MSGKNLSRDFHVEEAVSGGGVVFPAYGFTPIAEERASASRSSLSELGRHLGQSQLGKAKIVMGLFGRAVSASSDNKSVTWSFGGEADAGVYAYTSHTPQWWALGSGAAAIGEGAVYAIEAAHPVAASLDGLAAQLRALLSEQEFLTGSEHPIDDLVSELCREQMEPLREWFLQSMANTMPDYGAISTAIVSLARSLTNGDAAKFTSVAAVALSSSNVRLREAGVKLLESIGSPSALDILSKHNEATPWLRAYIKELLSVS
jgi:hypothetical protein